MSLRETAFAASRWTTTALLIRALLQVAQTMILARLLAPADFGLMAIAGATYSIAMLFVDMGLSNALIHFPHPKQSALSTLYWLNLATAVLIALTFMLLAWPLSHVYRQPGLLSVMLLIALAMPIGAAGQQFRVVAEKELRFNKLAVIEVVASTTGFITAVTVAMLKGGVYALVAAILISGIVSNALAWLLLSKGLRPSSSFTLTEVKPYLEYGSYRLGDALFNSIQSQADLLIGGALVGSHAMGVYAVPRDLVQKLANTVVNPVVTRVGLPVMASVQHDRAALKSVYLQTLRMTSSVNFPVYATLAVWADDAVAILLGPHWQQAVPYMRLLAVWGMIRSTGNPVGSLVYATGHVRHAFWWNFSMLIAVPIVLWFGLKQQGTHGLAVAMLLTQLLIFYPLFRFLVHPTCGASFAEYIWQLLPPLAATTVAVAIGFTFSRFFPLNLWLRLGTGGALTICTYVAASFALNRSWLRAMSELLNPLLRRIR